MKSLYAAITLLPLLSFLKGAFVESALLISLISRNATSKISWSVLTALQERVSPSATAALSVALARVLCAGGDEAAGNLGSCEPQPSSAPACGHLRRHKPVCKKVAADIPSPEIDLPTCQLLCSPRH